LKYQFLPLFPPFFAFHFLTGALENAT